MENEELGRGIFSVIYRDNTLTSFLGQKNIVTDYGLLNEVSNMLSKKFSMNALYIEEDGQGAYLINGVFVKPFRVAVPKEELNVDEISLCGESKTSLEFLAKMLNLPNIQEEFFIRHQK